MKQLIEKLTVLKNENGLSTEAKKALEKFIVDITPATGFLKLLSSGHVVKAVTGAYNRKVFAKIFTGWMDDDIENWACDDTDAATPEAKFDRYQLVKNGTLVKKCPMAPPSVLRHIWIASKAYFSILMMRFVSAIWKCSGTRYTTSLL